LTIELGEEIPDEFRGQMENWVFGCDICQEVCPWNRFSEPHQEVQFEPSDTLLSLSASEWHDMTEEFFEDLFIASAVKRTRYSGLKRNLAFLSRSR
jgi:epoxyqueuosine reductase